MNEPISSSDGLPYHPPDTNNEKRNTKRRKKDSYCEADQLDPDYTTKSSSFYTVGKVFSTLIVETREGPSDDATQAITIRFGQKAQSRIARFIVVQPAKGFSYACEIQTYSGRATLRHGCNPIEHAIVYMRGDHPTLLPDEKELVKRPIEIIPASPQIGSLALSSRIRLGKALPIHHNVKAKELGRVKDEHASLLVSYWRFEMGMDLSTEPMNVTTPQYQSTFTRAGHISFASKSSDSHEGHTTANAYQGHGHMSRSATQDMEIDIMDVAGRAAPCSGHHTNQSMGTSIPHQMQDPKIPRRDVFRSDELEYIMITEVGANLHSKFENINKPKSFFKKGRVFLVLLPELVGAPETERTTYWKIRRLVVIRSRASHCLCLPISTYQGKATANAGIAAQDHAAIVPTGGKVQLHSDEQPLRKAPLHIKVEDTGVFIDPMSRVNFARVSTVEYNLKVRNVGRIVAESIKLMEEHFTEALQFTKT